MLLVIEKVRVENNLFSGLIGSKTRIKLLIRFFLNPDTRSYLRQLAKEFNASTNSIREELNHLTDSKFLKSEKNGRHVFYSANAEHPLFLEFKSMLNKRPGDDQMINGGMIRFPVNMFSPQRRRGRKVVDLFHLCELCVSAVSLF